ncbi:hypothetical protein GGI43DRAFT_400177 [Trichoderma evansii]
MASVALSCAKSPDAGQADGTLPFPLVRAVPSEYPLVPGSQLLQQMSTRCLATSHGTHWMAKCPAAQQLSLIKIYAASLQKAAPAWNRRLAVRTSRPNTGGHLEQFLPQARPPACQEPVPCSQAAAKPLQGLAASPISHEAPEPGAAEIRRRVAHLASYLPHHDESRPPALIAAAASVAALACELLSIPVGGPASDPFSPRLKTFNWPTCTRLTPLGIEHIHSLDFGRHAKKGNFCSPISLVNVASSSLEPQHAAGKQTLAASPHCKLHSRIAARMKRLFIYSPPIVSL